MQVYQNLLLDVLQNGSPRSNRTGTDALSLFGRQIRINLSDGYPLLTTKEVHFKSIAYELLWFIRGDTHTKFLKKHNVSIWDEWSDQQDRVGLIYGYQWARWKNKANRNQLDTTIEALKYDYNSRSILISSWNFRDLDFMSLKPCHVLCQFYVQDHQLSAQVYQRSADIFLGVPFNIASYALFVEMLAHIVGLEVGELIFSFGDLHLYNNHIKQADQQLSRTPRDLPTLKINRAVSSIYDFKYEDFTLEDYNPYPRIKAEVAV